MNEKKSFWVTLPGIIAATATLLSAIGGLIVVLSGVCEREKKEIKLLHLSRGLQNFKSLVDEITKNSDITMQSLIFRGLLN